MEGNIKILLAVCMFVVFLVTLCGALLPLKVFGRRSGQSTEQLRRSEKIRSLCNCLAGGVFLATCFLGLLPSARKKFEEVFASSGYETDYPVTEAVVIAGFFLILILEQAISAAQRRKAEQTSVAYVPLQQSETDFSHDDSERRSMELDIDGDDDEDEVIFASPSLAKSKEDAGRRNGQVKSGHAQLSSHSNSNHSHGNHNGHSHYGNLGESNFLHSLILLLALSVHSIFEGMALGLQEDIKQIVYLLVAMVAHESLAAFALGASLLKSDVQLFAFVTYGIIFSSMIPIGTAIGLGIQSNPGFAAEVCSAIMQALAAGIFIFVTFFEILNHEFENASHMGLKLLCTITGYVALALLEIVG